MIIEKAILHVLDMNNTTPFISQELLDLSEVNVNEYIKAKIEKNLGNTKSKSGVFNDESTVLMFLSDLDEDFITTTENLATRLYTLFTRSDEFVMCDLLIVLFRVDGTRYLLMHKLNYNKAYTHFIDYSDEFVSNKIVLNQAIFTTEKQSTDESILINLDDYSINIIEKFYEVNGEKINLLSELFLNADTDMSERDSVKIVYDTAKQITKKHYGDDAFKLSDVKEAIYNEVKSSNRIDINDVADILFKDSYEARNNYVEAVTDKGLKESVTVESEESEKKFAKHRLKTDNGIDIVIPVDVYRDKSNIEIINNPDGTVSILLKNINSIKSR